MAVWGVILRGQQMYTVIQAVHSLLFIVAKCNFFSVDTWKGIIKYLQKCEGCTHFCEILYIGLYMTGSVIKTHAMSRKFKTILAILTCYKHRLKRAMCLDCLNTTLIQMLNYQIMYNFWFCEITLDKPHGFIFVVLNHIGLDNVFMFACLSKPQYEGWIVLTAVTESSSRSTEKCHMSDARDFIQGCHPGEDGCHFFLSLKRLEDGKW